MTETTTLSRPGTQTPETIPAMSVGDRIRFMPQKGNRWWTIRARDERFIVVTQQAPFEPKGELWYAVVDLRRPYKHNGVGPGMVRSSLNAFRGGWPYDEFDQVAFDQAIADLNDGTRALSNRRLMIVDRFHVEPRR